MEAVTHLMKSFERKHHKSEAQSKFAQRVSSISAGTSRHVGAELQSSTWKKSCSHHQRPAEALEPLVELGGVAKEREERSQERQQGDSHECCCCGCRETHKWDEGQNLIRAGEKQRDGEKFCMFNKKFKTEAGVKLCLSRLLELRSKWWIKLNSIFSDWNSVALPRSS